MYLIENGANVCAHNDYGQTPLHFAVSTKTDVAKEIILRGANIDAADKSGYTPLHEAAFSNNYEAVCMLLYYNADANVEYRNLLTPFMLSVYKNVDMRIQRLLLNYETDINRQCDDGSTSLIFALEKESEIIFDLLEQGADVNLFAKNRNTLDLSLQAGYISYFKTIFNKFNYDVFIRSGADSILYTLLNKEIGTQEWYELLELLIYSEQGPDIVLHCADENREIFFPKMFREFTGRRISQEMLVPIVATCLSYGVKVYITDAKCAFENFGNSEIYQMLMKHDIIINRIEYPTLPLLIADTERCAVEHLNNYSFTSYIHSHYKQLENVKMLLKFSTPSRRFKDRLQGCVYEILMTYGEEYSESVRYKELLTTAKKMSVPTLKELSRDACRRYISMHYGKQTTTFYASVKCLNIPEVVKKIISFQQCVNSI